LVRLAHPLAFSAFLRHIGAPVDRYFHDSGLPTLCEDPNAFVPLPRVWSFFDAAVRQEDPMLGWLVGTFIGDRNLSTGLLRKLEATPTLLGALRDFVRLVSSEASDLDIGMQYRRDSVLFYTRYSDLRQAPGYLVSQAYQISVILDVIRHFLGRNWLPNEIGIESPHVPSILEERFPGVRILAQQQAGYIVVPRSCLHRAACHTAMVGNRIDDPPLCKSFSYVDTLRAVLKSYLSEGYPSQQTAAELMNTTVRTLTRRLSTHGLTYGALIDQLRFQVAKDRLQNPDLPILDVAQSVGFNDQGNFTRMFLRVGGLTPGEFRRAGALSVPD